MISLNGIPLPADLEWQGAVNPRFSLPKQTTTPIRVKNTTMYVYTGDLWRLRLTG